MNPEYRLFTGLGWVTPNCESPTAASLLACGERIVAVGPSAERIAQEVGAVEVQLTGRTALPGMIDAHVHLGEFGLSLLRNADLSGSGSVEEITERLRQHANARGEVAAGWILGTRFDQELLAERRFPTRQELDDVAPGRPVVIVRVCFHAAVGNTAALKMAGIWSDSGLVTEDDAAKLLSAVPPPGRDELEAALLLAAAEFRAKGFTAAHCLASSAEELAALRRLSLAGRMPIRVRVNIPYDLLPRLSEMGLATGVGDTRFSIGAVKLFADGSLGARTAALTSPYADEPANAGMLLHSRSELEQMVRRIHEAECQAAIHAIGDLALDRALDALEAAQAARPRPDARHRIEHASVARPDQIERMARLGVAACVQPQFVASDFWTAQRLGPHRIGWAYPFRSMVRAGVRLGGGTDCPVERPDPWAAFAAAIDRVQLAPEESLTLAEAIRLFTEGAAWLGFSEGVLGAITPGALADFVVLPPHTTWPPSSWHIIPEAAFVGAAAAS